MGILSGYLGMKFFEHCYTPLGEMMDMLTLLVSTSTIRQREISNELFQNCMINFILYCTMSRQFRLTFRWRTSFTFFILKQKTIRRKIFKIRSGGSSIWCKLMRSCSQEDKSIPMENMLIEKYMRVRLLVINIDPSHCALLGASHQQ